MNLKKGCILGLGLALALGASAETSKTFSFALRQAKGTNTTGIYPGAPSTDADFAWATGYDSSSANGKKTTPYPLEIILKSVPFPNGTSGDVAVKFEYASDVGFVTFSNAGAVIGNPWPAGVKVSAKIIDTTHSMGVDYIATAEFYSSSLGAGATLGPHSEILDALVGSINGIPTNVNLINTSDVSAFKFTSPAIDFNPTNTVSWVVNSHKQLPNIRDIKIKVTTKEAPKLRLIGLGSK